MRFGLTLLAATMAAAGLAAGATAAAAEITISGPGAESIYLALKKSSPQNAKSSYEDLVGAIVLPTVVCGYTGDARYTPAGTSKIICRITTDTPLD